MTNRWARLSRIGFWENWSMKKEEKPKIKGENAKNGSGKTIKKDQTKKTEKKRKRRQKKGRKSWKTYKILTEKNTEKRKKTKEQTREFTKIRKGSGLFFSRCTCFCLCCPCCSCFCPCCRCCLCCSCCPCCSRALCGFFLLLVLVVVFLVCGAYVVALLSRIAWCRVVCVLYLE